MTHQTNLDLGDMLEYLNEGLQVVDEELRYRYLNAIAAQHGQRTREELLGRTMSECYPGIESSALYQVLLELLRDGGTRSLENEFRFPDGSLGWFDLRMVRIPEGVLILSIDVTERRRLEMQVRRMLRMDAVGQLAGGVSHDFNNLLTVIQSHASFLQEDLPESHELRPDVESILMATRRGAELTRRLLTFSRQLPTSAPGVVSVAFALRELTLMLRRTLGDGIRFDLSVDPDVGSAELDPSAFDQVLVNLIVNARDAVTGSGRITVEAERIHLSERWSVGRGMSLEPGEYVAVSVSDDGHGMSDAVLDRIFEPFYTTKDQDRGTGLGLASAWGLIEQAGGAISVYSEPGVGTTFRVYLRRILGATESLAAANANSLEGNGELVLVVEDQIAVREVEERILRNAGYLVHGVSSSEEALTWLAHHGERVAVLVTDVVMPRMSGLELAEQARQIRPNLPVLLVSGFTPRSLEGDGLDPRGLPMVVKPFTPEVLLRAVRSALESTS